MLNEINSDNTVEDELTKNVATIGENLNIRRIKKIMMLNMCTYFALLKITRNISSLPSLAHL